jgi:predicted outer membrane repeat protein
VLVDGPYEIEVLSSIVAEGTAEAPIVFSSRNAATRWRGLRFQNTPAGSRFAHCLIERSERSGVTLLNAVAPPFADCVFRNNTSDSTGGAISANGTVGDLVVERCTFSGNQAATNGGALQVQMTGGATLRVTDSLFENNIANPAPANANRVGGALYLTGDGTISNSQFVGNRSNSQCSNSFACAVTARGGAIYVDGNGTLSIDNSVLIGNRTDASNRGNCNFSGGASNSWGGGLYVQAATVTVRNTVFSCNRVTGSSCGANRAGAGLYVNGGAAVVSNSTLARNSDGPAATRGGGTLSLDSSILYFNNADGAQASGTLTVTHSDVQNGIAGEGNLNFNPVFRGPGCEPSDLQIVSGSPAIDTGNPDEALVDACFPPALGEAPNDMGFTGGPTNCAD